MSFDKASLTALKQFVQLISANPQVLHTPELSFFKTYLETLGANIPPAKGHSDEGQGHAHAGHGHAHGGGDHGHAHGAEGGHGGGHGHSHGGKECHGHGNEQSAPMEDDDDGPLEFKFDEPEPTLEVAEEKFDDGLEVVTPDTVDDTTSAAPNMNYEPSEEDIEKAGNEKQAALSALESGDFTKAITHYSNAIQLNPHSSLLVAGRADVFLKQKKPNAAIKDANVALQANPDSAKALKIRGKAYVMLGDYEAAHKDLSRGLQADYDDATQALAKKVQVRVDSVHKRVRKLELAKEEWMKRKVLAQRAWLKKKQEREEKRRQREEEEMGDDNPYAGAGAGGQPNMADFAKMFGGAGGAGGQPNMADFAKMFSGQGGAGGAAGGQPNMADFAKMFSGGGAGGAGGAGGQPNMADFAKMFSGAGRGGPAAGAGAGAGTGAGAGADFRPSTTDEVD